MNIRFTSSLTPEDENRLAPAVMSALSGILDLLPIAYVLQVETSDLHTYQHSGPTGPQWINGDLLAATELIDSVAGDS